MRNSNDNINVEEVNTNARISKKHNSGDREIISHNSNPRYLLDSETKIELKKELDRSFTSPKTTARIENKINEKTLLVAIRKKFKLLGK